MQNKKDIKPARRSKPVVSVMMCAYNAETYIHEAIQSVLAQTYRNFEFIIVDDGSTDRTPDIIRTFDDPRIRVIRCRHDYIHSLNVGMKACQGEFVARTDADDLMLPNRLKTQLSFMRAHADIAVSFSWGQTIGAVEDRIGHCAKGRMDNAFFWLLTGNFLMHPSAMLRRDFFVQHRLRYRRYAYAEDYKLWTDITRLGGNIYIIPQPLFQYRISSSQVSCQYHEEQRVTRLRIQQEVLEELLHRMQHPIRPQLIRYYRLLLKLNEANLLQGDEIIVQMYKILRRTKCFV